MGMTQKQLGWAQREQLDLYCRNKSKLILLDRYFESSPLLKPDGTPNGASKIYWTCYNATVRSLAELRHTIEAMAREDRDLASALAALDAEARR